MAEPTPEPKAQASVINFISAGPATGAAGAVKALPARHPKAPPAIPSAEDQLNAPDTFSLH